MFPRVLSSLSRKRVQDDISVPRHVSVLSARQIRWVAAPYVYFRSKHLDDVVSSHRCFREQNRISSHASWLLVPMTKLGLDRDARHGSIGVTMGTGSAIEQRAASSKKGPSVMESSNVYAARADSDESAESNDENDGIDTLSKAPPKCSYCGVDDHDEKSCPEQM